MKEGREEVFWSLFCAKLGRTTAQLHVISIVERLMYNQLAADVHVEETDKHVSVSMHVLN